MNSALTQLEQLSLGAMAQVLLDTHALPLQAWRTPAQINQALETAPRHAWIVRRWLTALGRAELLQADGDRLAWRSVPAQAALGELPRLYSALGFPPGMAILHAQVIERLPELLRDQISLAPLLFQSGEPAAVLGAYQQNAFTNAINQALAARAREVDAADQVLQVLELGGGAGCTSAAVLTALADRPLNYRFTDVSPLFTVAAQRQFRLEPGVAFALLDLDRDFIEQGIAAQSLDLVIAGNVLHNARNVPRSLKCIRTCLRDGGTLLFSESIADNPAMLTFMHLLLSPAEGAALRETDEVFMGPEQWRHALRASGFELREIWPADDQELAAAGQRLFHAVGVAR